MDLKGGSVLTCGSATMTFKRVVQVEAEGTLVVAIPNVPHGFRIATATSVVDLRAASDSVRDTWVASIGEVQTHLRGRDRPGAGASDSKGDGRIEKKFGADEDEATALARALMRVASESSKQVKVVVPASWTQPKMGTAADIVEHGAKPTPSSIGLPTFRQKDQDCDLTSTQLRAKYVDPVKPTSGSTVLAGAAASSRRKSKMPSPPVVVQHHVQPIAELPVGPDSTAYGERAPMRHTVYDRYKAALLAARGAHGEGATVLVLDRVATRMISAVMGMSDLHELGFSLVESLEKARQGVPMHAVYLLSPSYVMPPRLEKELAAASAARSEELEAKKQAESRGAGGAGDSDSSDDDSDSSASDTDSDGPNRLRKRRAERKRKEELRRRIRERAAMLPDDSSDSEMSPRADVTARFFAEDETRELESEVSLLYASTAQKVAAVAGTDAARESGSVATDASSTLTTSLARLIGDFGDSASGGSRQPKYRSASVVLISQPTPGEISRLHTVDHLGDWLQKCLIANLDFLVHEPRVFSLDMRSSLVPLFAPRPEQLLCDRSAAVSLLSTRLVSCCSALNEYPYVRFSVGHPICGQVAGMFQLMMDDFVRDNREYWYHGMMDIRRRSTVLLVSRTEDLVAPLMHEFSYQALVYDIQNAAPCGPLLVDGGAGKRVMMKLDESDALWVKYRHEHVAIVMEAVQKTVASMQSSEAAKLDGDLSGMSLDDLRRGVASLRPYLKSKRRAGTHVPLVAHCLNEIEVRGWFEELADVEQTLVTGVSSTGSVVKLAEQLNRCQAFLKKAQGDDKVRLVALYMLVMGGLSEPEQVSLVDDVLSQKQQDTLLSLEYLDAPLGRSSKPAPRPKEAIKEAKAVAKACKTAMDERNRVKPAIRKIAELFATGSLPVDQYPYVTEPPALPDDMASLAGAGDGKASTGWTTPKAASRRTSFSATRPSGPPPDAGEHESKGGDGSATRPRVKLSRFDSDASEATMFQTDEMLTPIKPRMIVFVAGGMTYSEIREVHRLGRDLNVDLILGSTNILTPGEFLKDSALLEPDD